MDSVRDSEPVADLIPLCGIPNEKALVGYRTLPWTEGNSMKNALKITPFSMDHI